MSDADRIISAARRGEDVDAALRPKTLDEFVGQKAARENLRVFIDAAKGRGEALDHVLFFGAESPCAGTASRAVRSSGNAMAVAVEPRGEFAGCAWMPRSPV